MTKRNRYSIIIEVRVRSRGAKGEYLPLCSSTMTRQRSDKEAIWNPDTVYALGFSRMLTQILGIWPLECQDVSAKVRIVVVVILEVSMGINLVRELKADCVAVDAAVNFVALIACSAMASMKVIVLRMHQPRMERLIKSAVADWSSVENSEVRRIMRSYARTGRFVFIFQMTSAFSTVVSLVLGSLPILPPFPDGNDLPRENTSIINESNEDNFSSSTARNQLAVAESQRNLPMGTSCFVSEMTTVLYGLVYVIQVSQLIITCTANVGVDVYFFAITMHVCGQFELLKTSFEQFGKDHDAQRCRDRFGKLVRRHDYLMTLSNDFEDTFNLLILGQLTANAFHMSLLGIQVIMSIRSGNIVAVLGALIAFYILSLQLFLYSYAGDNLATQIDKLRDSVYCCCWYDLPSRMIRDLIFVMSRSDGTFNLTAGKVYRMNIDNFKNILKGMGSYFSMLRIMFEA